MQDAKFSKCQKSSNHGFTRLVDANGCGNDKCKF